MSERQIAEWTWNHETHEHMQIYDGVQIYAKHLLWYHQVWPDWAGSAAREQAIGDFIQNGPPFSDVPPDVVDALNQTIREHKLT